jgi:transposase
VAPPKAKVDGDALVAHIAAGGTLAEFAEQAGVHYTTIQNRLRADAKLKERYGNAQVEAAQARGKKRAGTARAPEITVPEDRLRNLKLGAVRELVEKENGLDLNEWAIGAATVNKWGQPGEESRQVKVTLRPREWFDDLEPADFKPPRRRSKTLRPKKGEPEVVVFVSDHHAPYVEEPLHEASLALIVDLEPHRVIHGGDLLDLPTVSRHRDDPSHAATPQECVDSGYSVLADLREAAPTAAFGFIPGNHDDRLRTEILNRAERMFGLAPAPTKASPEQVAAMSLRHLLHLDDLGIELHGAPDGGDYHHSQVRIDDAVTFRHGWITGRDPAGRTMEVLGTDAVVGHTHHQRMSYATRRFRGLEHAMTGVEAGCMCRTDPGYMPRDTHNWQQGFVVASVWPDGQAQYEHARWSGGALRWRSQTWRP